MKVKVYIILFITLYFAAGCRARKDLATDTEKSIQIAADKSGHKNKELVIRQDSEDQGADSESKYTNQLPDLSIFRENAEVQDNNQMDISTSFLQLYQQVVLQRTQRSPSVLQQNQMNEKVKILEQISSASFEYHLYSYLAGNHDVSRIEHLQAAEKLNPDNSDVQLQLAAVYIIQSDEKNAELYLQKLIDRNRFSSELLNYAEDLLLSVRQNGTLITHGFDDTFPLVYLQLKKGMRSDVEIISLDLLQSQAYRSKLLISGYKIPESELIDVNYFEDFLRENNSHNLAVSMTVPKEYLSSSQAHFFPSGLVFDYSLETNYSNFYRNELLWDKEFQRKSLNEPTLQQTKSLNANYLPMLFQLREVYMTNKIIEKLSEVDKWIDIIAMNCNKYDQVQKLKGLN